MSSRGNEARVGAVVLAAIVLVVLAVLWVGGYSLGEKRQPFRVRLANVNGLEAGSAVRYAGHRVGEIVDARIADDDTTRIELTFEVETTTPVGRGAKARVNQVGLLADPFLEILPAPATAPALESGALLEGQETRSIGDLIDGLAGLSSRAEASLARIESSFDTILPSLSRVLLALDELLAEENRAHLESLLAQLDGMAPEVAELVQDLDATLAELDPLLDEAAVLGGELRSTLPNVDHFTASGADVFELLLAKRQELESAIGRMESTLAAVEDLAGDAGSFLGDNRSELEELLSSLRSTLRYLEIFSEAVARRPSSVVWSGSREIEEAEVPAKAGGE